MIETVLSLFGAANTSAEFYRNVSALWKGDDSERLLEQLVDHNRAMREGIERLSDSILYAPNLEAVTDITQGRQRRVDDLRELRQSLEPVQRALGGEDLLSSAMILTPERMQQALAKNPWEVLMDVRPLDFFSTEIPPEGMPVQFEHNGVRYMGWQMRGALPMLFDCDVTPPGAEAGPAPEITTPPLTPRVAPPPGQTAPLQSFRDTLRDGGQGPEVVILPPGEFRMGSKEGSAEQPVHRVRIDYALAMGRFPVTFADYDRFCEATGFAKPSDNGWGRGDRPVINVNWHEANEYLDWLAIQTGRDYRLPSEAEWEYACRAGTNTRFPFGDTESLLRRYAWFSGNAQGQTQPVGTKGANPWGLHDMLGNVWEWCSDHWHGDYKGAPEDGTSWELGGESDKRVLRGGSWCRLPIDCRPARRSWFLPGYRSDHHGFRVLCVVGART